MFDGTLTAFLRPGRDGAAWGGMRHEASMNWVARARRAVYGLPALAGLAAGIASLAIAATELSPAHAADGAILKRGDAAVTGFSGTRTEENVPQDVHPLDRTFIDMDGASLRIFDLSVLGTAPRAQLSDVAPKLQVKARDIGQVFGVTLDDGGAEKVPNVYATSTSMFGLQLVTPNASGGLDRTLAGGPGVKWMPGQFGLDKGGTPGTVYRIDGRTGAASVFATIKNDGRTNSGPGLGNIAFDVRTRQLFVSDLETGLIHRITLDGTERDVFDHGEEGRKAAGLDPVSYDPARRVEITSPAFNVEDSATWGYADERRRVFGLGIAGKRLYYSVAEGPAVWSVGIDDEGDFGGDPRIELELKNAPAGSNITSITFDGAGMMYLASRGGTLGSYDYTTFAAPEQGVVVRYRWDEKQGRWTEEPQEYAIGLKPEHRSALGGVALNYGYDKRGNIDYGKCRQTVWSTGEHLREGEDPVLVSLGGAKIVHGLQGNYKSRVKPQNVPPREAWFTDYDGRFEDAEAYGQVGAVAIYAPCESVPAYEASPVPVVPPEVIGIDPPYDDPGLIVDKRCYAGAIGGKIRCAITVRNVGDRLPVEDVRITDVTRILAGPGAGSPIPVVSVAVPNPAISCAAAPTPDFWCSIPAPLLTPGDAVTFEVWVDTHDLALAGNLGFRNCAVLKHPDGYAKACAEGGTDIVVEKIGPGVCMPGGTCKFGLRIANAGLMPYEGDVLLADAMIVGGGVTNAPITSVNPPVVCSAGNMNQLPFTCQTHLALAPGEEHIHWVEVTMPAPGEYWAENCFGVLDPALVPPGPLPPPLLSGGGAGTNNPSCVWIHVPKPKENLRIVKKEADPEGKCTKTGAMLHCKYEIMITNEGASTYNGPLDIQETIPVGATLESVGPVWGCGGGPNVFTCNPGGPVSIAPGNTISVPVTLAIKPHAAEAHFCAMKNQVKILQPAAGTPGNLDAADDTSEATEWTWGLSWEDPVTHATIVMCDPTNLKVTKTATGACTKSGDGYTCGYDVTITNMGPDPYKGPLKLTETFSSDVTNVSVSAPFSCAGGGTSFNCQTPIVEMAKDDSLTMHVEATVADDGNCRLKNTASLTFPEVGSKGNGNGADDTASATTSIPSRKCRPQTSVPPVTAIPLPRCPDGRIMRADGYCPCPQGSYWNADYRQCENPRPRCYDPARRKDDGTCCPRGTYYDAEFDRCRLPPPVCPDPERRRDDGTCCPYGTVVSDRTGRCVVIDLVCPPDTRWDYITRECRPLRPICPPGQRYDWRTRECFGIEVACPWGSRYNKWTKRCEVIDISCPKGTHWSKRKQKCVGDNDDGTTTQCPDGSPRMAGGGCRCPMNKRWNPQTQSCERPGTPGDPAQPKGDPTDEPCPQGTKRVRGNCLPVDGGNGTPAEPYCPEGKHRVGNTCVPDVIQVPGGGTKPIFCPRGQHLVGRVCVPDRIPPKVEPLPDCPQGKHRVGKICVPDRVIEEPAKVKPLPDCPDGKHRVGRACVPDRVIKVPPKIDIPPKKFEPKPAEPKVKIRPRPEAPIIKKTPQLEKFKRQQQEEKPAKVLKKFYKDQGSGGAQPNGNGGQNFKKPGGAFIKNN